MVGDDCGYDKDVGHDEDAQLEAGRCSVLLAVSEDNYTRWSFEGWCEVCR